jgi:hypothetical protein
MLQVPRTVDTAARNPSSADKPWTPFLTFRQWLRLRMEGNVADSQSRVPPCRGTSFHYTKSEIVAGTSEWERLPNKASLNSRNPDLSSQSLWESQPHPKVRKIVLQGARSTNAQRGLTHATDMPVEWSGPSMSSTPHTTDDPPPGATRVRDLPPGRKAAPQAAALSEHAQGIPTLTLAMDQLSATPAPASQAGEIRGSTA